MKFITIIVDQSVRLQLFTLLHKFGCLDFLALCRLFNAKSIFMKIVLFQTIQFSISTQFKCKYSLIVKNISTSGYSV